MLDREAVARHGFFQGYTWFTGFVVLQVDVARHRRAAAPPRHATAAVPRHRRTAPLHLPHASAPLLGTPRVHTARGAGVSGRHAGGARHEVRRQRRQGAPSPPDLHRLPPNNPPSWSAHDALPSAAPLALARGPRVRHLTSTPLIAQGFATSLSIVLSSVVSWFLPAFDFEPSAMFTFGSSLVIVATVLYSSAAVDRRSVGPATGPAASTPGSKKSASDSV